MTDILFYDCSTIVAKRNAKKSVDKWCVVRVHVVWDDFFPQLAATIVTGIVIAVAAEVGMGHL